MAVRRSIPYSLVNDCIQFADRFECMAMVVHYECFDLAIISVYRHPQGSLSDREYESFCLLQFFIPCNFLGRF